MMTLWIQEKKYTCHICPKSYSRKRLLEVKKNRLLNITSMIISTYKTEVNCVVIRVVPDIRLEKLLKIKNRLTNKIISIKNRDIHYNSVLFYGEDILNIIYIYIVTL